MPAVADFVGSTPQLGRHRLHGPHKDPSLFQLGLLIGSAVVFFILIILRQQTLRSRRAPNYITSRLTATSKSITWTPKSSGPGKSRTRLTDILKSLVPARQGQGLLEKQTKDARISIQEVLHRASPTDIRPVGLGGAGEGTGRMGGLPEEEATASSTATPSRGVSIPVSDPNSAQSSAPGFVPSSLSGSPLLFPAADEYSRSHVGISSSPSPSPSMLAGASTRDDYPGFAGEKGKGMEDSYRSADLSIGRMEARTDTEVHMPVTIYSPFAYHMVDDEHVSYPANEYYSSGSPASEGVSTHRRTDLNFARPPPPPPLVPPTLTSQAMYSLYGTHQTEDHSGIPSQQASLGSVYNNNNNNKGMARRFNQESEQEYAPVASSSKTRGSGRSNKSVSTTKTSKSRGNSKKKSQSKSIPIPTSSASRSAHNRIQEHEDTQDFHSTDTLSPSSFPSTLPLLPPPPPNAKNFLDPAAVMFPGGMVAEGGIRMVPTYEDSVDESYIQDEHDADCLVGTHEDMMSAMNGSGGGWQRHTRVYGGGICLACAATRGGGYYGARVRPEDKRR